MSDKRKAAMAAAMLTLVVGQAVALGPIALAVIGGILAAGAGAGLEWWFWTRPLQVELDKVQQEFNNYLVNDTYQDVFIAGDTAQREKLHADLVLQLYTDLKNEGDGYAWASAKRIYLDLRAQGYNHTYAKDQAINFIEDLYNARINTTINMSKEHAQVVCSAWNTIHDNYQTCSGIDTCDQSSLPYFEAESSRSSKHYVCTGLVEWSIYNKVYTIKLNNTYQTGYVDEILTPSTPGNKVRVFDAYAYKNMIIDLQNAKTDLVNNAMSYFDALALMEINATTVEQLLDPVTLATQFATDWNTTGYYRFAAAEAALTGIPVSLNDTVCFEINNATYCGVFFTNWDNQTFTLSNYTVPAGKFVYILDENNTLIRLGEGDTFRIINMTDPNGNPVNSTAVYRYIEHSGDTSKIIEELQKLNELWDEYMKMQALSGGGGFDISGWWNGLSDTEKILVVAAGLVVLILLTRRR